MTNNSENQPEDPQDSHPAEDLDYPAVDNKGLFGSAHKLATFDDTAAQLFKEITESVPGLESTSEAEHAFEIPIVTEEPSPHIQDEDEEGLPSNPPEPIHKDTLAYDSLQPESTYTANPAYTTGARIDPRVKEEGVKIPLAPVYTSDRIALVLAILATVVTLLCIFIIPAFYAGNLSNTSVLILVITPGVIALIAVLFAIPGLITKRHLP